MYNSWYDVFPEIVMISDKELQKKVVETYEEALKLSLIHILQLWVL